MLYCLKYFGFEQMKFRDIKINEIFFENQTGEYYKKLTNDTSAVWDGSKDDIYVYRHPLYKEMQRIECDFPPDHPVEEPEL